MFSLKDKVIVITGGTGLLGMKHAEAVSEQGGIPILLDRNFKRMKELEKEYPDWWFRYCDITEEADVKYQFENIIKKYDKVDGLINNACTNPRIEDNKGTFKGLEDYDLDTYKYELEAGLIGSFLCTKYFGSHMSIFNSGSIINIGSDLGLIGPDQRLYKEPKPVSYSVAKAGLLGLTRYTATYWPNIRCNYLALGGVYNNQPKEFVDELCKRIPMNRMATPNEYKGAIVFLLSDASKYMTGAVMSVDGGRTAW